MRRPTPLPRLQRKPDLWARCENWVLTACAVAAYFVIVHFANH